MPDDEPAGNDDRSVRRTGAGHVVPARYHGSPDSPPLGGVFAYAVGDRRRRPFDATGAAPLGFDAGRRRTRQDATSDELHEAGEPLMAPASYRVGCLTGCGTAPELMAEAS